jgi:Zn-dependent protease with chaperone function
VIGALILMPLLPLIMMRLAAAIAYGLLSLFMLGPLVALVLRTRRRLADATAVQLTRHPDGLACALVHLAGLAHAVPGVGWAEMLFIVGPETVNARRLDRLQERMAEVRATATGTMEKFQGAREAVAEVQAHTPEETEAARHNFIFGFHPSLNTRIIQLKRLGATKVDWTERRDYSAWILAAVVTVVGGCVVLLAVAGSK